jgi:hypothetical protein
MAPQLSADTLAPPVGFHRLVELCNSSLLSKVLLGKADANSPTATQKQATPCFTHYNESLATMTSADFCPTTLNVAARRAV